MYANCSARITGGRPVEVGVVDTVVAGNNRLGRAGVGNTDRVEGLSYTGIEITARTRVSRPTVIAWRTRYERYAMARWAGPLRSGPLNQVHHGEMVPVTGLPLAKLGATHWSSGLPVDHLGVSFSTVTKGRHGYSIQPWRSETSLMFSTEPELVAKVTGIAGLYLAPVENAIGLWVDEKRPTMLARSERRTRYCIRHGTARVVPGVGDRRLSHWDIAGPPQGPPRIPQACHPHPPRSESSDPKPSGAAPSAAFEPDQRRPQFHHRLEQARPRIHPDVNCQRCPPNGKPYRPTSNTDH